MRLGKLFCCVSLVFALITVSCGKKNNDDSSDSETGAEVAVSTGVGAVSGAAGAGVSSPGMIFASAFPFKEIAPSLAKETSPFYGREAFAKETASSLANRFGVLSLIPAAQATVTSCSAAAYTDSCSSGVRSASYTSCPIGSTGLTYSGTVALTFSRTSTCLLFATNDTLTRTVNLTRTGLLGSTVTSSSDSHADYRGNTIEGGTKITKTSGGYSLEVLGMHKYKTNSSGSTVFDVSVRSTQAFTMTNPTSTSVTVDSGTLEVIHNKAQYVATFSASNLVYDYSSCCYPSSGTLSVSYSGAITGSGSVSFGGSCGTATLTKDGNSQTVTLLGCQ